MNSVIDELLQTHRNAVYISEDGVHGGYALMTSFLFLCDCLKYSNRRPFCCLLPLH